MSNIPNFSNNEGLTQDQIGLKFSLVTEWTTRSPVIAQEYDGPDRIGASDLESFIDLIAKMVEDETKDEPFKIKVLDEYPENNILEDPLNPGKDLGAAIVYYLRERAPGTTAGGNTPLSRERRETTARYRGWSRDEVKYPNQIIMHYGKVFDNVICFEIAARTAKHANKIADWFEQFMEQNKEIFAKNGIVKYHFDKRESDQRVSRGETVYHVRPMVYFVRTERTYSMTENTINKLVVKLSKT